VQADLALGPCTSQYGSQSAKTPTASSRSSEVAPELARLRQTGFLHQGLSGQAEDERERWVSAPAITVTMQTDNLFRWHVNNQESFLTLHQMALDTLSIPAMSTKCKRVFSSNKKLLSPQRSRIKEDLIEASECLKARWDCRMVVQ
jgi:redox-regulated HSP33 family molecular chaperone